MSDIPLSKCKGWTCDAMILWATLVTKDGERKTHPFDPEPVAGGKYRADTTLLGDQEMHHDASLTFGYRSHYATCPDAPTFRKDDDDR